MGPWATTPGRPSARFERALAAIESTLDRLVARGHDTTAFELARSQFAASVRSSWPSNLSTLVGGLKGVAEDATLKLDGAEREELRAAIGVLSRVKHE